MLGKSKKQSYLFTLAVTVIWGLLAHGYCYFNLMYNHDCLLVYQNDAAFMLSLGRALKPLYFLLRGHFYNPTLVGALSLVLTGTVVYLVMDLFRVKNPVIVVLAAGVMVTNTTVTLLNASYLHDADSYMLTLLLVTLAVWICRRYPMGFIPGAVVMVCGLGLYQSYIQVAVYLLMMLAIWDVLQGRAFRETLIAGVKSVVMLLASLVGYAVLAKAATLIGGVYINGGYNSISYVGHFRGVGHIIRCFLETYFYFFYKTARPIAFRSGLTGPILMLSLTVLLGSVIYTALRRRTGKSGWLIILLLMLILPFGVDVVYFISMGNVHDLMNYSFFLTPVFALIFLEEALAVSGLSEKKGWAAAVCTWLMPVLVAVMLMDNIQYSNEVYLKKDLEFRTTMETMNRIIYRMESTEGYELGKTPVAIMGLLERGPLSVAKPGFDEEGLGLNYHFSVTFMDTYQWYFDYVLGYPIELQDADAVYQWAQDPRVQDMPVFPSPDAVQMIDGTLIVKLSEDISDIWAVAQAQKR